MTKKEEFAKTALRILPIIHVGGIKGEPLSRTEAREAIARALQKAVEQTFEESAKIADERAHYMNILGSDANMTRKMTHAEIQSERVLEAQEIAKLIRERQKGKL